MRIITSVIGGAVLAIVLASPAPAAEHCGAAYTIRSGDSLGKVAKRCGYSVKAILAANPEVTNPRRLKIGQKLAMPGESDRAVPASVGEIAVGAEETVLKGRIFAGRWCALIETAEGKIFGLASSSHSFRSDTNVEVKGHLIGGNDCGQTHTLAVSELSNVGLKF